MPPALWRVGIMARHVSAAGGVGAFTREIVRYLLAHADGIEYHVLYHDPAEAAEFADLPGKHVVLRSPSPLRWDQVDAPSYAEEHGLSLLLNGDVSVPVGCRVPTAVVVPGSGPLATPDVISWRRRWYHSVLVPAFCRRAAAVITHTQVGREDCEIMGAKPENIYVVPRGIDPLLQPASGADKAALRVKYDLPRPYILFVGAITPRKNVGNLLRAFASLPRWHKLDLVLAGYTKENVQAELEPALDLGLQSRVRLLGHVPDEDLGALYSAAECLVLPSWYAGFGIPILEAMACGCPVVTSSGRHPAPEVAGGAALLVDPADPAAIAHGIRRILEDAELRQTLIVRGHARGRQFSWEAAGRLMDAVIRELIARPTEPVPASRAVLAAVVRTAARLGSIVSERLPRPRQAAPAPDPAHRG